MLPVCMFGAGCATYIGIGAIPWPESYVLFCLAGLMLVGLSYKGWGNFVGVLPLAFALGLATASYRVDRLNAPVIESEKYASVTGQIVALEERTGGGKRITLRLQSMNGRASETPVAIRIIVRTPVEGDMIVGSMIRLAVILSPPNGAVTPDGYDFARRAYFKGLVGEGFAASPVEVLAGSNSDWRLRLEHLRLAIAERILAILPDDRGAVAVALLVGYRHYLPENIKQDFREAGLAHLMAISGLHLGLVSAAAFFVLEMIAAAFPALALRMTPRKIAAIGAFGVAAMYLMLSGMSVSTVRAFIMVCVALLAVLLDRRVLSLRSVAIAALTILLISPEAILDVGFQMSFAATAALVVVYEDLSRKGRFTKLAQGWLAKLWHVFLITGITTIVAELAVAPFALFHFQATPTIGLGANLMVVPVFSLVIMPLALISLILMPIGLDTLTLPALGEALDYVLSVAHWFGNLSFGVYHLPQQSSVFLLLTSFAFLIFLVVRGRARVGAVFLFLGLALLFVEPSRTMLLLDNAGGVVAERWASEKGFSIAGGRRGGFRDANWARYWGVSPDAEVGKLDRRCDIDACLTSWDTGEYLAKVKSLSGLRQSCAHATIVIVPKRWHRYCRGSALVITEEELQKRGPAGISYTGQIQWSREFGYHPWQVRAE